MKKKFYAMALFIMTFSSYGWAQSDSLKTKDLKDMMEMSLEELMNITIVSASKKEESLFDAPLSASVLTKEEIRKSGVTSIMEALRLMPGLIVRETTNGNYNIHIRGLDNVPPNATQSESNNTTTLVMINNRPVFNYQQGDTFWQSLPVDLIDVEKIEVVRGASATLYGPNAVSGVINIITRQTLHKGWNTAANASYGSLNTAIANASVGYQFNDKFSAIVSGNYQRRGREVSYYKPSNGKFYSTPDSLFSPNDGTSASAYFPYPDRSMDKYGANAFIAYHPREKVHVDLTVGLQDYTTQDAFFGSLRSNLSTLSSRTAYLDLKANLSALSTQVSYLSGKQTSIMGEESDTDFSTVDVNMEYEIKAGASLSIKPGLGYHNAILDDTPFLNNARRELYSYSGSLRLNYKALKDKLRFAGGIRVDQYNYPQKACISYQFAPSYKLSDNHLIRGNYSRAYRASFVFPSFLDYSFNVPISGPTGSQLQIHVIGNKDVPLMYSDIYELGYRSKLASNFSLDVEAYHTITRNSNGFITGKTTMQQRASTADPILLNTPYKITELPLSILQTGVSVSVNYIWQRLQVKPFLTWQHTNLQDYSPYKNTAEASPSAANGQDAAKNNYLSGIGSEVGHKSTPNLYGGAFINYALSQKLNLNLSPYYYTAQTYLQADNLTYNDGNRGVQHIDAKLLLNTSLTYSPTQLISAFVSIKNLFNDDAREYYKTDQMGTRLQVGLQVAY